jgi:hypothetical protein
MSDTYRKQVPPHLRSLPEQTLDALLRIEELLTRLVANTKAAPVDLYQAEYEKLCAVKASQADDTVEEEKPTGRRSRK